MDKKRALRQLAVLRKHQHRMRLAAEEWHKEWQTLISTMLSARTRDEVTIVVCNDLFKKFKTPRALASANISVIKKAIKPVNFYKTKAKHIIETADILDKQYKGRVPHDFDKLIQLPGVGRKTANVFLSEMGKDNIGVDTHVFYISRYLGWTRHKDSKKIEEDLKKLFDRKYWKFLNPVLVRFGKTHTSRKLKNSLLDRIKQI